MWVRLCYWNIWVILITCLWFSLWAPDNAVSRLGLSIALLGTILSLSLYLALKELNLMVPSCLELELWHPVPCTFFYDRLFGSELLLIALVWFGSWFAIFVGLLNHRTNSFLSFFHSLHVGSTASPFTAYTRGWFCMFRHFCIWWIKYISLLPLPHSGFGPEILCQSALTEPLRWSKRVLTVILQWSKWV